MLCEQYLSISLSCFFNWTVNSINNHVSSTAAALAPGTSAWQIARCIRLSFVPGSFLFSYQHHTFSDLTTLPTPLRARRKSNVRCHHFLAFLSLLIPLNRAFVPTTSSPAKVTSSTLPTPTHISWTSCYLTSQQHLNNLLYFARQIPKT